MANHEGGCLCGAIRYEVQNEPLRVTICHCRFCQYTTGSAYMVEPIFDRNDFRLTKGTLSTYARRSEGSGKMVTVHFCPICATKIYLGVERSPQIWGVFAGTLDDPNWFKITSENTIHIFLDSARHDTIVPAGMRAYREHRRLNDDTPTIPTIFDQPHVIGRRPRASGAG